MDALLNFFEGFGVNRWNFAVLEQRRSGEGYCMKGDARPRDRVEVVRCLPWAGARNHAGHNVYLRPARHDEEGQPMSWPVVLLDDVSPELALKIAEKYCCAVVETSTKNCQIWLACDRSLNEWGRRSVQNHLIGLIGADDGSKSGEHFGRAPGFRNKKPNRRNEIVKVLTVSSGKPAFVPPNELFDGVRCSPPAAACVVGPSNGSSEESHKEFKFACIGIAHGDHESEIIANIADRAFARGKRRTLEAAIKYAEMTVKNARRAIK